MVPGVLGAGHERAGGLQRPDAGGQPRGALGVRPRVELHAQHGARREGAGEGVGRRGGAAGGERRAGGGQRDGHGGRQHVQEVARL